MALDGMPFRPETFAPFLDAADATRQAKPLTRASLDGTALLLKLDSQLLHQGGQSIAVMPLRNVNDPVQVQQSLTGFPAPDAAVELLDLKTASDSLLHNYRREALTLALLGSGVIASLLTLYFRSPKIALVVLAPLVFAVVATMAILTMGSGRLSICPRATSCGTSSTSGLDGEAPASSSGATASAQCVVPRSIPTA